MPVKIIIVEDLDEIRKGLEESLSTDSDFEVLASFKNAEEATGAIAAFNPDIVIMDISLPCMSGLECIRRLKPLHPRVQFMVFTVYEDDGKVFEALTVGATAYLLKTTEPVDVIKGLKELYKGGSPMSASIARKLVRAFEQKQVITALSSPLSNRENEVLHLLGQGLIYKEIASKLSISPNTVRQHIHKIYEKLHVQNRVEALNKISKNL